MENKPGIWRCAFGCFCPRCGKGKLYSGILNVVDRCSTCGMALAQHEKGDGPAFFVIILVGFLSTGLAAWVELAYSPPLWVHAVLWPPFILLSSLYFLRVCKAALVALQFAHRLEDFES